MIFFHFLVYFFLNISAMHTFPVKNQAPSQRVIKFPPNVIGLTPVKSFSPVFCSFKTPNFAFFHFLTFFDLEGQNLLIDLLEIWAGTSFYYILSVEQPFSSSRAIFFVKHPSIWAIPPKLAYFVSPTCRISKNSIKRVLLTKSLVFWGN